MSDDILNLIPFHPFKTNKSAICKNIRYNAIDSQSGILVSVADKGLYFYDTNAYEEHSFNSKDRRDKLVDVDTVLKINIDSEISWAEFNCSGSYLLIAIVSDTNLLTKINIIDVEKTINEKKECLICSFESNDEYTLQDVKWHPIDESSVLVVMNDIVHLCIIKDNKFVIVNSKSNAFCVSWSPKGKQFLVVMRKDGTENFFLNQYDNMMVEKRSTEIMSINNELKVTFNLIPIEVCWYSTYHCIIGFRGDTSGDERFKIFVCNFAIKTSKIQVLTDVGSSSDCINPNPGPCARLYYMHILEWNTIILVNNSSENAVIYEYDNDSNLQIIQTYCLPVDGNVIGLTCDFSSNKMLPVSWLSSEIKQSSSNPILFLKLSNSDCFGIYLQHSLKKITTKSKMSFNVNPISNDSNISVDQSKHQLNNSVVYGEKKIENSNTSLNGNKSNLFGLPTQDKPSSNIFGNQNNDKTTGSNLFGTQNQERPSNQEKTSVNIFGGQNQGQSPSNIFGTQNNDKTTGSNLFGTKNQERTSNHEKSIVNIFGGQNKDKSTSNLFGTQNQERTPNQEKSTVNIFGSQSHDKTTPSNLFGTQNQGQSPSNIFEGQNKDKSTSNLFGTQNQEKPTGNIFGSQNQEKSAPLKISGGSNQLETIPFSNTGGIQNQDKLTSSSVLKGKFNQKSISSGDEIQDIKNKEKKPEVFANSEKSGSGDHEKSSSDKKRENIVSRQVLNATKSTSHNKVDMIDKFLPDAVKRLEKRINEIKINTNNFIRKSKTVLNDDKINKEISTMFRDIEQYYLHLDKTDKENKNLIDRSKTLFQDIEITLEFTTRFQEAVTESKIKNRQYKPSSNPLLKKISLNLDLLLKKVDYHLKDLEDALDYMESKQNGKSIVYNETVQLENIDHLLRSNIKSIKIERSKIDLLSKHLNDSLVESDDLLKPKISNFQCRYSNLEMEKYLYSLMCKRPVINLSCKLSENKQPINIEKKTIKTPSKHSASHKKSNEMIKTEPKLVSITPPKPVTMKLVERNSYKLVTPNSLSESVPFTGVTKPIQISNSYPEMLPKENFQINSSSSIVNKSKNTQSSCIKDEIEKKSTEVVNNTSKSNDSVFSNKSMSTESNTFLSSNNSLFKSSTSTLSQAPETSKPTTNLVENLLKSEFAIPKTHKSFTTVTPNNQIIGSSTTSSVISSIITGNSDASSTTKSSEIIKTSKTNEGLFTNSNKTIRDNESKTSPNVTNTDILKSPSSIHNIEAETKLESIVNTTPPLTSSISPSTTKSSSTSNLVSSSTIQSPGISSPKPNSGLFGLNTQSTGLFNTSKPTNNLFGSAVSTTQPSGLFVTSTSSKSSLSVLNSTATTAQLRLFGNSNTLEKSNTNIFETTNKSTPVSQFTFTDNSNTSIQSSAKTSTTATSSLPFGNSSNLTQSNSTLFGSPGQPVGSVSSKPSGGLFNSTNQNSTSLFGSPVTTESNSNVSAQNRTRLFGTPTTSSVNSQSSGLFSTPVNVTQSSAGLFGSSNNTGLFGSTTNTTQSPGLFETNSSNKPTSGLFGNSTSGNHSNTVPFGSQTTSSQQSTLFGSNASIPTNSGLFGNSNQSAGGIFGSPKSTAPTPQSTELLSTQTQNKSNVSGGLFGNSGYSNQNNLFGSSTNANTQSTGLFGQASPNTSKTNLFGDSAPTVGGGLFGSSTSTTTQSSGLFGNQSINNNTTGGIFGNSASPPSTGFFGKNAPSPNTGLFASPAQNNQQSSSLFGTSSSQNSVFSSSNLKTEDNLSGISFGGSSFISGLGNHSSNNTKNIFSPESTGGSSTTSTLFSKNQSNTPGNLFNTSSNTGSLFGNNSPATSQTSSSLFGSRPAFGTTNQNNLQSGGLFSNSIFGNNSDNQMTFGDMATNNQSQSGFAMNSNQPGNIFQTTTSPSFTQRRM